MDELSLGPDCLLVGVIRGSQLLVPHGDTRLEPGDELLAVVRSGREQALAGVLGEV